MIQTLDVNPDLAKAQNAEAGASKFCPGCGHGMILKTLAHTIDDFKSSGESCFWLRYRLFASFLELYEC